MAEEIKTKFWFSRSPIWPALLSGLVAPGLGQIANGDFGFGVFLLMASLGGFSWFSKILTDQLSLILTTGPDQWSKNPTVLREAILTIVNQNPNLFLTFEVLLILVWFYGVLDAYLTAKKKLSAPSVT